MSTAKKPRPGRRAPLDPDRLWRRRIKKGISQQELADLSGISATHVSRLEMGQGGVSPSALGRLARALDCDIADLMPGEPAAKATTDLDVQRLRNGERAVPNSMPELRR